MLSVVRFPFSVSRRAGIVAAGQSYSAAATHGQRTTDNGRRLFACRIICYRQKPAFRRRTASPASTCATGSTATLGGGGSRAGGRGESGRGGGRGRGGI